MYVGVLQDAEREDSDWSCSRKVPYSAVDQGGCLYNGTQWRATGYVSTLKCRLNITINLVMFLSDVTEELM